MYKLFLLMLLPCTLVFSSETAATQTPIQRKTGTGMCYGIEINYDEGYTPVMKADFSNPIADAKPNWGKLTEAAEKGSPEAQLILGVCYEEGYGVPLDQTKSAQLLSKAAGHGTPYTKEDLDIVRKAVQSWKNLDKLLVKLTEAAEKGDPEAQLVLGLCYEEGYGVPLNWTKSAQWISKAAAQGMPYAEKDLENIRKAVQFWKKTGGNPNAALTGSYEVDAEEAADLAQCAKELGIE